MTTISRAQAGILGTAAGVIAGAASAQAQENADREAYRPRGGYGYEPDSRRVRAYDGGCGFHNGPIFDEYGDRIDARCVPAC